VAVAGSLRGAAPGVRSFAEEVSRLHSHRRTVRTRLLHRHDEARVDRRPLEIGWRRGRLRRGSCRHRHGRGITFGRPDRRGNAQGDEHRNPSRGVDHAVYDGTQESHLVTEVLEGIEHGLPRDYTWPGNVRELEQAVRRILLTGRYAPEIAEAAPDEEARLIAKLRAGELTAAELLAGYCGMLHRHLGTYAEVAKRTALDPRTARKYVEDARSQ
jgi:hypothetical protein